MYSPYHLASSSLTGETATGLDLAGGAAFFLEKRATGLKVEGFDAPGAEVLTALLTLRGLPSISFTPMEAAGVDDAANEAIFRVLLLLLLCVREMKW